MATVKIPFEKFAQNLTLICTQLQQHTRGADSGYARGAVTMHAFENLAKAASELADAVRHDAPPLVPEAEAKTLLPIESKGNPVYFQNIEIEVTFSGKTFVRLTDMTEKQKLKVLTE